MPQLETSVFIIPWTLVNNGDERLVVLNRIAKSVVEARRWISPTHVFTCKGKPIHAHDDVGLEARPHEDRIASSARCMT